MIYVLIFISLTLASIAGFQFLYLFFLERVEIEHKKRLRELERQCKQLNAKLHEAELRLSKQNEIIDTFAEHGEDESWADLIGEH